MCCAISIRESSYQVKNFPQKKHAFSQKADPLYVVTNLKNWDLPFHPYVFEKNNGCEIKRVEMKTNGSHGPLVLVQENGKNF